LRYAPDTRLYRYSRYACNPHMSGPLLTLTQPVLLMALDDYLLDPSQDVLARLFDAINSMDLSLAPNFSKFEKFVLRSSERKDIFAEKFSAPPLPAASQHGPAPVAYAPHVKAAADHRPSKSNGSLSSFEEGILMRSRAVDENRAREDYGSRARSREKADTESTAGSSTIHSNSQPSPSDASFDWVGDQSGLEHEGFDAGSIVSAATTTTTLVGSNANANANARKRRSTDATSSTSSYLHHPPRQAAQLEPLVRSAITKDTRFFNARVQYKDYSLPINMPLATFPEEVGDVSFSCHFLL
jgi:hypothetical protein